MSKFINSAGNAFEASKYTDWQDDPLFIVSSYVQADAEPWSCAASGTIEQPAEDGIISGSFSQWTCTATGFSTVPEIDGSFEAWTGDLAGQIINGITGSIDLQLQSPTCQFVLQENKIDLTFVPLECEMINGEKLILDFQEMQFTAYSSHRSKPMDCTFKELDLFMTGASNFNEVKAFMQWPECYMQTGASLDLEAGYPGAEMTGTAGLIAGMDCSFNRPDADLYGGPPPYIDAILEQPTIDMFGDCENISHLDLLFRNPTIEMSGASDLVGNMSVSMQPLKVNMTMDLIHPVGMLSGNISTLRLNMTSQEIISGDILIQVERIRCDMQAFYDALGGIDAEMTTPTIKMTAGGVGGTDTSTCAVADTLTFED